MTKREAGLWFQAVTLVYKRARSLETWDFFGLWRFELRKGAYREYGTNFYDVTES